MTVRGVVIRQRQQGEAHGTKEVCGRGWTVHKKGLGHLLMTSIFWDCYRKMLKSIKVNM